MAREQGSVGGSKPQRERRPFVRYLTGGALLITLAVVGLLWHRISEQGRELAGLQQALVGEWSARGAADLPPPVVFIPGRVPRRHAKAEKRARSTRPEAPIRLSRKKSSSRPRSGRRSSRHSLRSTETSLQLGRLECRGRMCGLDVSFERLSDGVAGIERLTRAAESLPDRTLVHVVTRPGRTPNDNVGRIFFEWQLVDAR